jgi:hypothetical protein
MMTEKVTMEDIAESLNRDFPENLRNSIVAKLRPLIERYADQAREEARAESYLVIDDLREKLEGALVPKFRMGDKVSIGPGRKGTVEFISEISYIISDGSWVEMTFHESSLSPLPEKCQHEDIQGNKWANQTFWGVDSFKFCPSCGESLTSGEGE